MVTKAAGDNTEYEMILSIDEADKKRFISMRENGLVEAKESIESVIIGKKNVVMERETIVLEPSEEIELFTQDVHSVAKMIRDRRHTGNSTVRLNTSEG